MFYFNFRGLFCKSLISEIDILNKAYQRNSQQNCRFAFSRSLPYLENTSPYLDKHQLNLLPRWLNYEMRHKFLSYGKKSSKCTERKRFYFKTKCVNLSNERNLISPRDRDTYVFDLATKFSTIICSIIEEK